MSREKFPNRRATTTINITHKYAMDMEPRILNVSYSRKMLDGDDPRSPTGPIKEFWLNCINGCEKLVNVDMHDSCVGYSKDLQNGDSLDQLYRSVIRDSRGKALGFIGSIIDALRREPIDA